MKKHVTLLLILLLLCFVSCATVSQEEIVEQEITEEVTETVNEVPAKTIVSSELIPVIDQDEFIIEGLYLTTGSGIHDYETTINDSLFSLEKLNSEYELNEWISYYLKTTYYGDINLFILKPNEDFQDYSSVTVDQIKELCYEKDRAYLENVRPDSENFGYLGMNYVHQDYNEPGPYDLLICSSDKVYYKVKLNLIPCSNQ